LKLVLVVSTVASGWRTWKELKSREVFSYCSFDSRGILIQEEFAGFHGRRHHRRVKRSTPPRRTRMLGRASSLTCERTHVHTFRWRNGEPWRWPSHEPVLNN